MAMITQNSRHFYKIFPKLTLASTFKYSTNTDDIKPEGWEKALAYENIPGPKPLPLIGNLWMFLPIIGPLYKMTFLDLHKELYKKYGKIVRLETSPSKDFLLVFNPNDMETVFRNDGVYPVRHAATKTRGYYREVVRKDVFQGVTGLFTFQGKEWHDLRSKVNPILMHPQKIFRYTAGIDLITNDLLEKIRQFAKLNDKNEMPGDFLRTIYAWSLEVVACIALDTRTGCLDLHLHKNSEANKMIDCVLGMFQAFGELEFGQAHRNIYKTKLWKHYVECVDFLTFIFLRYIEEAETRINKTPENGPSALQELLKLDRKIAIAIAMDMLSSGVDTAGKQAASVLYFLAKNQNAQDALRKELVELLPNKDSPVTKEVLEKASYLKAVIKETERLVPIVPANSRQSTKEMVLSGYKVPKGTTIFTCHWVASNLEENYHRAAEFLPERWLRATTGELSHNCTNKFATLPFGFGPRYCVGKRIAQLEMEIGIAKIIRNFRLNWNYKDATFNGSLIVGILDPLKIQFNELEY